MAVASSRLALIAILIIVGIYFLIFHGEPFPLNHEAIGLGKLHIAHAAFGIILMLAALFVWRKSRTVPSPVEKAKQPTTS